MCKRRCAPDVRLTTRQRCQLVEHYAVHHNVAAAARQVGVNPKTARRWVLRHEGTKDVQPVRPPGRPRALDSAAAAMATDLLLGGGHGSAFEVANELFRQGKSHGSKPVHRTTLVRHAKAAAVARHEAIKYQRRLPQKQLSEQDERKRAMFAREHRKQPWGAVLFTDRCKIQLHYPGVKVKSGQWLKKGQRRRARRVNHAQVCNVYFGISKWGTTKVHFVCGTSKMRSQYKNKKGELAKNITAAEYEDVVAGMLQEANKVFSAEGVRFWTLQQDNDPTHKNASTRAVAKFNTANKHGSQVYLMQGWPPNSPDLNPIENLWAIMQKQLMAAGPTSFDDFKNLVERRLEGTSKRLLKSLVGSMPRRMEACIAAKGAKTKY